jgi:hypothetical protein
MDQYLFKVTLIKDNFLKPIRLHFSILDFNFLPLKQLDDFRDEGLLVKILFNSFDGLHKVKVIILDSLLKVGYGRFF